MKKISHLIAGKPYSGSGTRSQAVFNPATGEKTGEVIFADQKDVEHAINVSKKAFEEWSATPAPVRAKILFKYKSLMEKYRHDVAQLVTAEHGKLIADAEASVDRGIEIIEFACGVPNLLKGSFSENVSRKIDSYTFRQPLGVCAGVSPFNFPVMIPAWMFVPAIACGNTFVLKPSEKDPSAALRIVEIFYEAGLPEGVLNVVNGDKEAVDILLSHPDIKAVTAVGSTPVAESIYHTAIANGKRAHTFGGAKNHAVVMPDADLSSAADAIVNAAYGAAGERCMALSVAVVVGDDTADKLIKLMKEKVEQYNEIGPLVTKEHLERVKNYVDIGVKEGAELVVDGRDKKIKNQGGGFYLSGCLFDKVQPSMRIYKDEIFGPVLSVVRVNDFDTALGLVNAHEYGNGTAVFTRDGATGREFASRVQVGMVGINVPIPVPVAYHSFGGWKRSIFGDIAMHGGEGVMFYTKTKTVTSRW